MKFFTLAALVGLISGNTFEIKKDQIFLRDEMKSLLNLVQTVESEDADSVLDAIEARKEKLKVIMTDKPERNEAIANEFRNLLAVVENVETNDYEGAMVELRARKDELLDIHHELLDQITVLGEEEEGKKEENKEEENKEEENKEEEKKEEPKKEENCYKVKDGEPVEPSADKCADAKKEFDAYTTAKGEYDTAKTASDAAKDDKDKAKATTDAKAKMDKLKAEFAGKAGGGGGSTGLIVGGVVGVLVVGGLVYYFACRKDEGNTTEGGDKEIKTLYKAQMKAKKVNIKEELV